MCGIAGFVIHPDEKYVNTNTLAKCLLLGIEHRGKDATGAAWRTRNGEVITQKRALIASDFIEQLSMPRRSQAAVLHTRAWTQGEPTNPNNNHPLTCGPITGVHNGIVSNDWELFTQLHMQEKRQGKVDSEAIFATLAWGRDYLEENGKPVDNYGTLLELVEGMAAVAWLDVRDPQGRLHVARLASSPLHIAQTAAGSFFFASTKDTLVKALDFVGLEMDFYEEVKEGTYLRIDNGMISEDYEFETCYGNYGWQPYRRPTTILQTSKNNWYDEDFCLECGDVLLTEQAKAEHEDNCLATWTPTPSATRNDEPLLDAYYLSLGRDVKEMDRDTFAKDYAKRIEDAEEFLGTYDDDEALLLATQTMGLFARPGDWVRTTVCGEKHTYGQIYKCPQAFPDGDFVIRVLLRDPNNGGMVEPAFVKRTCAAFELLKNRVSSGQLVAVPAVEAAIARDATATSGGVVEVVNA
jgi:hypothetical protein